MVVSKTRDMRFSIHNDSSCIEGSGWIEVDDLPAVLELLDHVPPQGLSLVIQETVNGENKADGSNRKSEEHGDNSRSRVLNWIDMVVEELDRNKDRSIARSDFIDWWVSQCPSCIPLRDCPTETGLSVRRVALEKDDAQWMFKQCPNVLGHLPKAFNKGIVPMVCSACWDEYRRRDFVHGLDLREQELMQRYGQEPTHVKPRQKGTSNINPVATGNSDDETGFLRELAAQQSLHDRDLIDLPEGV